MVYRRNSREFCGRPTGYSTTAWFANFANPLLTRTDVVRSKSDQRDGLAVAAAMAKAREGRRGDPVSSLFIFAENYGGLIMKVRPLGDRVLVKRIEEEEKTKGGIIIPDTAKEKPQEGRVMAVGSGKTLEDGKLVPLEVKTGDKVLFGKYSGNDIKLEGEEHLIVRESDILGVIEG
jgi:chaperonin GroES